MEPRTCEREINNEWVKCEIKDLQARDKFRMFESTGEPVMWNNTAEFYAVGEPYTDERGLWKIRITSEVKQDGKKDTKE